MLQNNDPTSCNCISGLFPTQEKWFLTRQKDSQEDSPIHSRNRSSELKIEAQGRPLKRSLKKRPSSNSNISPHQLPPVYFEEAPLSQLKINFEPEQPNQNDYSFSIIEDLPPSSDRRPSHQQSSPPPVQHASSPWDMHPTMMGQGAFIPSSSHPSQRFHPQSHTMLLHDFQIPHLHHHQQPTRDAISHDSPHVQKVHYPVKCQQETQSWIPQGHDELIIEDFHRLFKREEHQSQTALAMHPKTREAKRSKRLQKQLVGRFAQSDDEACSESAPSEVIGKGFDSHFNAFWEDEPFHFEETLATRSTNTKFSEKGEIDIKPRFGTDHHFKSYRNL